MKKILKIFCIIIVTLTLFACDKKEEHIQIKEPKQEEKAPTIDFEQDAKQEEAEPIEESMKKEDIIPITNIKDKGDHKFSCYYDGYERTFLAYPAWTDKTKGIVVVLHGYNNSAESFEGIKFELYANYKGYAVFYVDGLTDPSSPGSTTSWNIGISKHNPVDDVGFLKSFITYMQDYYKLTKKETFMAGFSAGGIMTYKFANEAYDYVNAVASVCGRMFLPIWENREEVAKVSLLQVSGTSDLVVPMKINGSDAYTYDPAIEDVVYYFANSQGLNEVEKIKLSKEAMLYKYSSQETTSQVWHVIVNGGQHGWYNEHFGGFSTNELVLDFFDEVNK